ncbi:AAA family ATPase [Novispirillum sp. DQ9]|uniref:bifunctional aminoglycoside phosphotransferase/ATP-binding protein n=1 Tax=Novispirillum sp. DQ9 TaxID=3398612 RepID=UPI003C7AF2C8
MNSQSPDPQDAVLAFLADPATHGPGVTAVERVDTHISAVFLPEGSDRVIKVKKAVTLPFLDFAPLEARRLACEREAAINRRTAPDLYLGCAPVVRRDGALAIGDAGAAEGEVVDWVVLMRRFDRATQFDRLAAAGKLDRNTLLDLAEAVAQFHEAAESVPDPRFGGAAAMAATVEGNAAAFAAFRGTVFDAAAVDAVLDRSREACRRHAALLDARRVAGLVKRCHGDLHLRNICQMGGRTVLFDAIEFNDDFAVIDVLYDLAFLLMDLRHAGLARAASLVFNHYMDLRDDLGGLPLLPLMLSLRAQIRAHVTAAIAGHAANPEAPYAEARRYLVEAADYLTPPRPRLIAVGGLSGSGKSRAARELAPYLGAPGALVLRSDVIRKRLAGRKPWDRLESEDYSAGSSDRTYALLTAQAAEVLAAGHPVIADAVFSKPAERAAIEAAARQAGAPFAGLWLEAEPAIAEQRILMRRRNASDATPEVLKAQLSYDTGPIAWTRVDSSFAKDRTDRACRKAVLHQEEET